MKHITLLLLTLFCVTAVFAQEKAENYLWPIQGQPAGTGIILSPQEYIEGEFNFDHLFITAPAGTVVVAPADGTVQNFSISYGSSLTMSTSYHTGKTNFDEMLADIRSDFDRTKNPLYLSGMLGLQTADGKTVYISGLTGDKNFKTGQKISKGEELGKVGYSYHKIKDPSIGISISKGGSLDPMAPFGLETTFKAPEPVKISNSYTKEQVKEDFLLTMEIIREIFPGLHNIMTIEEFEKYIADVESEIDSHEGNWIFHDVYNIILEAVSNVNDSHMYIYAHQASPWKGSPYYPQVWFGWIGGELIITNATEEYGDLIGRRIETVNGLTGDEIKPHILSRQGGYDGQVEQVGEHRLATQGFFEMMYNDKLPCNETFDLEFKFYDGEEVVVEGRHYTKLPEFIHNLRGYWEINRNTYPYEGKVLNPSTAFLAIPTFELNQVQVEEIGQFIAANLDKENLIIDVRNNGGGHAEVIGKLYSYIAGDDPATLNGYQRVTNKGVGPALSRSNNYSGITDEIFPDFQPVEGKEGYFNFPEDDGRIFPDPEINYKGKVYVLTNEGSISAATLFPAHLVRNRRGVVVGRETATAYHFMNALKFTEIGLPNSRITLRVPLVENVFDDVVNERVPYGRGLIPDYPVPFTLDELFSKDGDVILNYTLQLIEEGKYLSEDDPFELVAGKSKDLKHPLILGVGLLVATGVILTVSRKKRK